MASLRKNIRSSYTLKIQSLLEQVQVPVACTAFPVGLYKDPQNN